MASRLKCLTISILLVALLTAGLHAADIDQIFSISKKLDLQNRYPRVAIDPETGNAFVVWVKKDDDGITNAKIYGALCVKNKAGKYKAKKAGLMSAPGDICEWHPKAAYNPDDDSYLVVWSSYPNIRIRKVSKTGRAAAGINTFTAGADSRPVIAHIPVVHPAPVSSAGRYLLAYAYRDTVDRGLYTCVLDADGIMFGQAKLISGGYATQADYPTGILRDDDGTYLIAHIKEDKTYGDVAHVARVRANGSLIKESRVGTTDTGNIEIVQLFKKLFLATFNDPDNNYYVQNQLFKSNLKRMKGPFEPLGEGWSRECCLVKLNNSDYVVQIIRVGTSMMYYRLIDTSGNFFGEAQLLKQEEYLLGEPSAACLPGSNTVFVAYSLSQGSNNNELRGLVFNAVD